MEETNEIRVTVSFKTVPPESLSKVLGVRAVTYESEEVGFLDTHDSEEHVRDFAIGFVNRVCREIGITCPRTVKIKQTRTTEMEL